MSNDYIEWAKSNYGGYTYANAVEFSIMMAERLGWSSYGDEKSFEISKDMLRNRSSCAILAYWI